VEDLKERYYSVCNRLVKARGGDEGDMIAFDAPHEVKRKMQMERLLARTKEQVEEEEMLCAELKKIEMRKKEREKKQQDLQKLISAAEQNTSESRKTPSTKKYSMSSKKARSTATPSHSKSDGSVVFKSYDKSSGVSLRSSKMKTPMTLGQKKTKAIDQLLDELGVVDPSAWNRAETNADRADLCPVQ
jgi:DNA methyltransferase 1-associated protein 1